MKTSRLMSHYSTGHGHNPKGNVGPIKRKHLHDMGTLYESTLRLELHLYGIWDSNALHMTHNLHHQTKEAVV